MQIYARRSDLIEILKHLIWMFGWIIEHSRTDASLEVGALEHGRAESAGRPGDQYDPGENASAAAADRNEYGAGNRHNAAGNRTKLGLDVI